MGLTTVNPLYEVAGAGRAWQPEAVLSADQIAGFLADGYAEVRGAIPSPVIAACPGHDLG